MEQVTNWEPCILRQKGTNEKLVCPLSNPIVAIKVGAYKDLLKIVEQFNDEVGYCPYENLYLLSEHLMKENSAFWHRSCRDLYKPSTLQKAITKKRKAEKKPTSSKRVRRSTESSQGHICLFCQKETGEKDHSFQRVELTPTIREKAVALEDFRIAGLLAPPNDLVAIEARYYRYCYTKFERSYHSLVEQHQVSGNLEITIEN